MAKKIKFVFVGKIKLKFLKEAEEFYLSRLKNHFNVEKIEIKDGNSNLPLNKRIEEESDNILKKILSNDFVISLDEKGELISSHHLAKKLTQWIELPSQAPCFIVGGAYGLSNKIKNRSQYVMSLSPMTFTHEIARVVLLEQIYRAYQIILGSPYHH